MVREDLITSAVTFLNDPSVSASPVDKRIAFLQSKNLTQEEIDAALVRAGDAPRPSHASEPAAIQSQHAYSGPTNPRQATGYSYGYAPLPAGPWNQPPPPSPRRDWRDWFIMATVTTGLGYGLYTLAQRYVVPLIAPPTPPQLEQDKAAIDGSFNKAFALIDQLVADTASLKASEVERTQKLDGTLKDVDTVIADLKAANARREIENRMLADQVQGLKDLVPKALEGWKANGDARLDDLSQEMKSLKKLIENRVGKSVGSLTSAGRGYPPPTTSEYDKPNGSPSRGSPSNLNSTPSVAESSSTPSPAPGVDIPRGGGSPLKKWGVGADKRAAIPAWQMAAAGKGQDGNTAEAGA